MEAPQEFTETLTQEFGGRVRIRWSKARDEWHLEYKVARAVDPEFVVSEIDDHMIRARDGYGFIMAVRPGDRMPCPDCGQTIKVPVMSSGQAKCDYCVYKGRHGRYSAAYYPLGDMLIERLRFLDPLRGYRDGLGKMLAAQNRQLEISRKREFQNEIEAVTKDRFNRMFGIQQVGYTGKILEGTEV